MKILASFLLLVLLCCPLQPGLTDSRRTGKQTLYPVDLHGKWGYINASGHLVIPARFDEATYFSEGLAAVRLHGKTGYINDEGAWVISPRFTYAFAFREKLAWVEGDPSGFIDRTGRLAIPAPPDGFCREFREGLAKVTPLPASEERNLGTFQNKVGFINRKGYFAIPPRFEAAWDFQEGLAAVKLEGKWGFIHKSGAIAISPQFDNACYFSDGAAAVMAHGNTFFIDKTGRPLFNAHFEGAVGFSEGLAAVKIGGKWGYIARSGRLVVSPQFDECASFFQGRASIVMQRRYGYIDRTGRIIVPPTYAYGHFFLGELAGVTLHPERSDGAGTGYLDRQGKVVWKPNAAMLGTSKK